MCITAGRRGSMAALLGFAALVISGSAAGATNHVTVNSTAARSKAALACKGMARSFQADVFMASTARGAGVATADLMWRGVALKAASLWLRSGCLSIAP
jgi:hypothetical protein